MNAIVIIIACAVVIAVFVLLKRSRIVPTASVTSRNIQEVISQLDRSSQNGHFVVFMFIPPDSADGEAVNLQYSIENGVVGLDWVLLGPRNIADRDSVCQFASKLGYRFDECEMNGVHYLRVAGSGISELGAKIIEDFYHVNPDIKLELITEGFKWGSQ
jgi:hypothetical protein